MSAGALAAALPMQASSVAAEVPAAQSIIIPAGVAGPRRHVTTDDLVRIRDIDNLFVSPDGQRFAILVRQAAPEENDYRKAWFIGSVSGGALTHVGDGGEARLLTHTQGQQVGEIGGGMGRWSPDGRRFAYLAQRDGEVQVWVSRTDGSGAPRQLTRNASDVRDLHWSEDGQSLFFSVGSTRRDQAERLEARQREGFRLQEFASVFRALNPGIPEAPLETALTIWRVGADGGGERAASEAEQAAFAARQRSSFIAGAELDERKLSAALRPPVVRADGAATWLERDDPSQDGLLPFAHLMASLPGRAEPVACDDPRCSGQFYREIWWSGENVVFWRVDGPTDTSHSLYVWTPATGEVRTIVSSPAHLFWSCDVAQARLICLRESPLEPRHVAVYDVATGAMTKAADVNPEFASYRLGQVERVEWDTPQQYLQYGYSPRAGGFILYPPDYDPSRTYPVFVAPYVAGGFLRGDLGDEHPLLVYAANGFIVVNSAFPSVIRMTVSADTARMHREVYDPARNYPHLSLYVESTLRGLDLASTRASIDRSRVGMGGVSHGAFIPLYATLWHDRVTALSVAGGAWSQLEYYLGRMPEPQGPAPVLNHPEDPNYWEPIDLARHTETIEAPILFHIADREVVGAGMLIRRLVDAHHAVDAYSFPNETHEKWQSAHRMAVYNRNLDWFRFWLADVEDPDPAKAEQYARWRELRTLQCRNPRSLRNYCEAESRSAPIAR